MNKKQLVCMWLGIVDIVLTTLPFAVEWLDSYSEQATGLIFLILCIAVVTGGFIMTFKSEQKQEGEMKKPLNLKRGMKRLTLLLSLLPFGFFLFLAALQYDETEDAIFCLIISLVSLVVVWAVYCIIRWIAAPLSLWLIKGFYQDTDSSTQG